MASSNFELVMCRTGHFSNLFTEFDFLKEIVISSIRHECRRTSVLLLPWNFRFTFLGEKKTFFVRFAFKRFFKVRLFFAILTYHHLDYLELDAFLYKVLNCSGPDLFVWKLVDNLSSEHQHDRLLQPGVPNLFVLHVSPNKKWRNLNTPENFLKIMWIREYCECRITHISQIENQCFGWGEIIMVNKIKWKQKSNR